MNSRRAILLVVLLEFFIVAVAIFWYGFSLTALQTLTRFSGRLSLVVFSFIFLFQHKQDRLTVILSDKPYLIFTIAHGIHLIELLLFISLSGTKLIPIRLAGGLLAYALIFFMPVLSAWKEAGKLALRKFFIVETFFLYYVWFIFFMTYLPRVQGKLPQAGGTYQEHVILLAWVCAMLGMKVTSLFLYKSSRRK